MNAMAFEPGWLQNLRALPPRSMLCHGHRESLSEEGWGAPKRRVHRGL